MSIHNVQRTSNRTHNHPTNNEGDENVWKQPTIPFDIASSDAEPVQPSAAKEELKENQEDTKFRLICSLIKPNHHLINPVRQEAGEDQADDGTDESSCIEVAGVDFIKPQWWSQKHRGQNHTDK